jgi:hypothetical protein
MANLRKRSERDVVQGGRKVAPACLVGRHKPAGHWVLRPALVGAGVVIPKVHFDRACTRDHCTATAERLWAEVEGETRPLEVTLPLVAWLKAQGARIAMPAGEIRVPDEAEVSELLAKAAG